MAARDLGLMPVSDLFLQAPPGPMGLRAPRMDEGSDILGSIAAGPGNPVSGLARLLMQARPALSTATMGLGGGPAQASVPLPPPAAAPVKFLGMQERAGGKPPLELWNLTTDLPGHPKGSTLTRATLEKLGLAVPPAP